MEALTQLIDIFLNLDKHLEAIVGQYGVLTYLVLFLIIFPLLTSLIYLIARGHGMAERQVSAVQAAQADADAYIRSVAATGSPAEEIAKAKALHDSGAINDEEYASLKAKALG